MRKYFVRMKYCFRYYLKYKNIYMAIKVIKIILW